MQVFERVVALAEQQHRRFAKGAGVPHRWGVKLRACLLYTSLQSGVQGMLYGAAGDDAALSAAILQVLALPDHGTALGLSLIHI